MNVGRFAATLSAGAGYTWTVPAFTSANLIQRPIYETRWLSWLPTYSAGGSMTYTTVTTDVAQYYIRGKALYFNLQSTGTTGGSAAGNIAATLPFDASASTTSGGCAVTDESTIAGSFRIAAAVVNIFNYSGVNWVLGASRRMRLEGFYAI